MAFSATANPETVASLNGLFKEVYSDGIKDLVPAPLKLQKMVKFVEKAKQIGNIYHQPVLLAYPSGFTHQAGDGTAGAYALALGQPSTMKDAQVQGAQILLREYMDYETAARAAGGRNAFLDATSLMFENMQKAHRKRLETQLLYGAQGIGVVSSYSNPTITLTTAKFGPGIWAGSEGSKIAIMSGTSSTIRGVGTISSVDLVNRTVTLSADVSGTTANDVIYWGGVDNAGNNLSGYNKEMTGLHGILANTGSLFNISASSYSLWASTVSSAGSAAATFNKVKAAVALAVAKGLDEDVVLLLNPKTWDNILSDLSALRRFVEKQGKGTSYEIGSENIVFYAQNGKIELVSHPMVWEGYAYGITPDSWKQLGASPFTFETPGYGGQIFTQLAENAGFEVRSYSHSAIFCEMPGRQFYINNIVNA